MERARGTRDTRLFAARLRVLAPACGFSARQLAHELQISLRQLERLFRHDFDCTPREWLREERLQTGQRLLQASSQVKHVAYALGYDHPSQFTRDFRFRFHITPSAFARSTISSADWPAAAPPEQDQR
jgi:AraC-like DNA-binding protein